MKLPLEWILERVPLAADAEEIADRLTMAGFEVEGKGDSARGPVLDIKVTPNRGDGLSVMGVARELSAAYRVGLAAIDESRGDPAEAPPTPTAQSNLQSASQTSQLVMIESPDLCPRYAACIIRNVKVGPSPDWLRERVEAAGMRSINNVVDVTNYVMLETGQPLHAFDYDSLAGKRIVVRTARAGESLETLDGVSRALSPEMLVIADAERPVALAGIMGGAATEMTDSTGTVLLESAHFVPLTVRRTARALDMATEASYRFQRYVDPMGADHAVRRAAHLIARLGAGAPDSEIIDVHPRPLEPRTLIIRSARAAQMLGFAVTEIEIRETLGWLGFTESTAAESRPSTLSFEVPSWRPDIVREIDLIEEVGRVLGYERIPEKLPEGHSTQGGDSAVGLLAERIRESLAGAGLHEVVSHSLTAPSKLEDARLDAERVPIRSALSADLSGLRQSLLPGLMEALERNARRANSPLAFFEIGHVFRRSDTGYDERSIIGGLAAGSIAPSGWDKQHASGPADYYTMRGIVERLAGDLHIERPGFAPSDDPRLHRGRAASVMLGGNQIGFVGELHPRYTRGLRLRDRIIAFELSFEAIRLAAGKHRFTPLSAYPAVSRDLAPRVPVAVPFADVESVIEQCDVEILESVRLSDVFEGAPLPDGVKSLTLTLTFRASNRTLADADIVGALGQIRAALEAVCGATFAG